MSQCVTKEQLEAVARAALVACEGGRFVQAELAGTRGAAWLCGAGKAVAAMAKGALRARPDLWLGPLIGKDPDEKLPILVAGHPFPDERGVEASRELRQFLAARRDGEEVIFVLSGGASALLAATVEGISLAGYREITGALLRGGASIHELNVIRRHAGLLLGGRMALATRARLTVLALSDVAGDDPATIGSGPASADPSSFADALAIARRYAATGEALDFLSRGNAGEWPETPKPGDPRLARARVTLLATPATLREKAVEAARAARLTGALEADLVDGDVGDLAARYVARLRGMRAGEVCIFVGEPTVRVRGAGRGGRSQQLALDVAQRIAGRPCAFLAIGSDGSDGPTDAAGAVVDGETWPQAISLGHDPQAALDGCDAYPLLDSLGALLRTGPTGTNLLDLHLLAA